MQYQNAKCAGAKCCFAAKPFARRNDCSNWDEVDVTFVQTRKSQSFYYLAHVHKEAPRYKT